MLTELNDIEIMNIFAKNQLKKFHAWFFNASEQIKNNAESRIIIDRFLFFEIFSKLEFFDDFLDATFDHEVFKINKTSISFNELLVVIILFFYNKIVINCFFMLKI